MIARELGLSADERALVEEIVNQYVAVFQMEAEQVQKAIARAEGTSPMALPDLVDRKEIRERAQAEMRPSGDAIRLNMDRGDSAERRERAVEIIREELELEVREALAMGGNAAGSASDRGVSGLSHSPSLTSEEANFE